MEMLIVVAIIAVLVAIAIPVFMNQLENTRDSTSVANMRSAYAEAMAVRLTGTDSSTVTYDASSNTATVNNVTIETQSASTDWSGYATDLPFTAPTDDGTAGKRNITFTFNDATGVTTAAWAS